MRLDIALMHRLGGEVALDNNVGRLEACLDVAKLELDPLGDIRRLVRRWLDALREHVVMQDRRVILHRFVDIDDVRQHLVIDLDQIDRLVGDFR